MMADVIRPILKQWHFAFVLCLLCVIPIVVEGGTIIERPLHIHTNAWKEFETIYRAASDLGGGGGGSRNNDDGVKVNHIPPTILEAIATRLGKYVPSSSSYKTGCVVAADQLVGTPSKGTYNMILPPETSGHCVAQTASFDDDDDDEEEEEVTLPPFNMTWVNENQDDKIQQETLPAVDKVYDAVFARRGPAIMPAPDEPTLNWWFFYHL